MEKKKKKIIIGSVVGAVLLVSALAIGITINIKNEKEAQEVARLKQEQQEKEAQELKAQQEQEEKVRQERLAKLEEGWNALGEKKQYLTPNSGHFNVTYNNDNTWKFTYSAEFAGTLYSIADGWYQGASIEDINKIINIAIPMLPENPTGKDVYDTFVELTEVLGRETVITGQGTSPYDYFSSWGDDTTNTDTTQSQQTTNNNQSNNNSSNKNNSNKNTNSNSSSNNSDSNSSGGISAEEGGATNGWNVSTGDDAWDNVGDVEIDEEEAKDFLEGLENFNGNNGGN